MYSMNIMKEIQQGSNIAVMLTEDAKSFLDIAHTIIDKGLHTIEVTLTTPNAIEIIAELSKRDDALIGAGTVLDSISARTAILNGAKFIVSPSFDKETAKIAN